MSNATPRIGFWAAILAGVFGTAFSVIALLSMFTTLIPELWRNPAGFAPSLPLAWCYLATMVCFVELVPESSRIWARLGLAFATIYATMNTIVYFTQLTVVSPALFAGAGDSVAVLQFGPNTMMMSINGLAYGLMSVSALLASQALAVAPDARFARWAMLAHGVIAPFIVGALFWPAMTALGALWIVTFPAMAVGVALLFRRAESRAMGGPSLRATLELRVP